MNIGDKVKTNDYYLNIGYDFIKRNPLKLGIIQKIEELENLAIVHVNTGNGKIRMFNKLFLETI